MHFLMLTIDLLPGHCNDFCFNGAFLKLKNLFKTETVTQIILELSDFKITETKFIFLSEISMKFFVGLIFVGYCSLSVYSCKLYSELKISLLSI